jgi:excisionase family DNA binding protein
MAQKSHEPEALMRLTNDNPEGLLTVADVADWFGVSRSWVYDHVTRKQPLLPCIRIGEVTRFRRVDIEKFIEEHSQEKHGLH